MHFPQEAAGSWTSRQATRCANRFSFPQTQRSGLLDSTASSRKRSSNQHKNLEHSFQNLLDALNVPSLQHATA